MKRSSTRDETGKRKNKMERLKEKRKDLKEGALP